MKNKIVEMPEPIEVPTSKKKFSIPKAVALTITVSMIALSLLHTASAMFKDPIKETETRLEQSLGRSLLAYHHQKSMNNDMRALLKEGEEQQLILSEPVCDNWKALRAFREANKIPLEHPEVNTCRDVQAPSEVGYVPPVVPGAEGQIEPDPAFR